MRPTVTGRFRSLIADKGVLFLINHLVLGPLALWLTLQLVPLEGLSSNRNLVVRILTLGSVAVFGYLSFVLGRRGNARLLPCFVALCLAGELLMRASGPYGVADDISSRYPQPYFMFSGPPNGTSGNDRQIRFNSGGFRIDGEVGMPKSPDEIRIFVVGGSTVVNGTTLADSIPGAIEAALRADGWPRARVYNFGVTSFLSGQELSLLVHRLTYLHPDLVIAYDGANDLTAPWFYDPRPGYPFNFLVWEEALNKISNLGSGAKTIASLAEDSAMLQVLIGTTERDIRAGRDDLRRAVGFAAAPWKRALAHSYASNIVAMCRIARANGFLFDAYFQPILAYSQTLDRHQVAMSGGGEMLDGLREERRLVPAAISAEMNRGEAGCRFSDVSDLFEDAPAVFTDAIHVTDAANQLIARRIARELRVWDAFPPRRPLGGG
jgi:lysophospholipase L1-like esterase